MAYAALASLSQTLLEQLVTNGDQHQIKSLHEKLCSLQTFLEEYAYNSGGKDDPLEERIREAAYQAADVIELHILNQVHSQCSSEFKCEREMQGLEKRYKEDLQRLNANFNSIVEEAAMKIKTNCENETPILHHSLGAAGSSSTQPPILSTLMVGFDEDLKILRDRLCGESPKLQVLSIVGMGGIGKTTLAKTIFDDSFVDYHFYLRAWLTISQEYCMRDILLGLLTSLNAFTNDLSTKSNGILEERVYRSLKGKRYLIIMDDMWSTKAWDEIRRVLPDDNNRSRAIITTRLSEVAIYADSSSPLHQMQLLNGDQSWSLLRKKVFGKERCPPELEKIGNTIAGKCGGLPLGIVLVAGILSKVDATLNYWEKFAVNVSSTLATNDEHLFNILSLSYNNLPYHLRACFLYMGGFPEDREISISRLTRLWTAEGFLKPITSKSSEEAAEEYVVDLVNRNLLSVTKNSSSGRIRLCRIHDLLRDFCIQKAHDENFLHVRKNGNATQEGIHNKHRRICYFTPDATVPNNFFFYGYPTPIITSNSFVRSHIYSFNHKYLKSFAISSRLCDDNHKYLTSLAISSRLLRVLDGPNVSCIPEEVTKLFHLRYLAILPYIITFSDRFVVPEGIFKLKNIQTLIIGPQNKTYTVFCLRNAPIIDLPPKIWVMPNLRHLILNFPFSFHVPLSMFGKLSVLENLQTLISVANFSFVKETIEMIPNLKKLRLLYHASKDVNHAKSKDVNRVINWSKYQLNNLFHLHQLESLNLTCMRFYLDQNLFPENFALPLKLRKLSLSGCRLSWINMSMIGRLPNFEVLKLRSTAFEEEEWKSSEGEFLQLKYLLMEDLNVKCWQVEEYTHFPSLETLIIRECNGLKEIPSEIGVVPTLQCIELTSAVESIRGSAFQIKEEQRSLGNDYLQVHVLP